MSEQIARLSENPRAHGTKQLRGESAHRARVGDYRIVYDVDDVAELVTLLAVGHRREIYR